MMHGRKNIKKRIYEMLHTSTCDDLSQNKFMYTYFGAGPPGDRIPVGARFSASVHSSPGTNPASYTMCIGSLLGVKRPGRDVHHPPPYSAEVKERVDVYLYSTSGPSWSVIG